MFLKYYVIRENPAYWGANSVLTDQHSPYVYIRAFFYKLCRNRKKVVSADAHMWQKVQALIRRRTECAASDQSLFFSSLHQPSFPWWRHKRVFLFTKKHLYLNIENYCLIYSIWDMKYYPYIDTSEKISWVFSSCSIHWQLRLFATSMSSKCAPKHIH